MCVCEDVGWMREKGGWGIFSLGKGSYLGGRQTGLSRSHESLLKLTYEYPSILTHSHHKKISVANVFFQSCNTRFYRYCSTILQHNDPCQCVTARGKSQRHA